MNDNLRCLKSEEQNQNCHLQRLKELESKQELKYKLLDVIKHQKQPNEMS